MMEGLTSIPLEKRFNKYFETYDAIEKYFSPGRVNLIGEHIDYNGGFVLPAALTIGITALVRKNSGRIIRMRSTNIEGEIYVDITKNIIYDESDGWGNYPKGVFAYLKDAGVQLVGCDILFSSNLPDGAGLSSSAALEVLAAFVMMKLAGNKEFDRIELAKLCQKVENEFIGVNCGIMDQFAVALGLKSHAILLDCNDLNYKYVPFELKGYKLVIMNTNKRRELADSKYNERRGECDRALAILNEHVSLKNLCLANLEQIDTFLLHDNTLYKRARHVVTENQRVLQSIELLKEGKIAEFGKLMIASHFSLQNDFEVSGFELDTIVSESLNTLGCCGARMTGAGFGGCAIALVENSFIDDFIHKVKARYYSKTNRIADFYVSSIGDGVHKILSTNHSH